MLPQSLSDFVRSLRLAQHFSEESRHLIKLVLFNVYSQVSRDGKDTYLGYLWWVLDPLVQFIVYYVVFGVLLQIRGEGFALFLFVGLTSWTWFNTAVMRGSNSIYANRLLVQGFRLPVLMFPITSVAEATVRVIPLFIMTIIIALVMDAPFSSAYLALPLVMLVQALMCVTFVCCLAPLVVVIPDFQRMIVLGLRAGFFLSGVFFSFDDLGESAQGLLMLNPEAFLITAYRDIILKGVYPDFSSLLIWGLLFGGISFVAVKVYSRMDGHISKLLIQAR